MGELDDFLAETLPRQIEAEKAIHSGDPTPRLEMWSTEDPARTHGEWKIVYRHGDVPPVDQSPPP